jgi:hypothetical protein
MAAEASGCVIATVSVVVSVGCSVGPSNRSTAARLCSGARWLYRTVIAMVLWPRSSCTVRMSTPFMVRRLAKVCRKQCQVKSCKLAALTAGSNQRRGVLAPPQTNLDPLP